MRMVTAMTSQAAAVGQLQRAGILKVLLSPSQEVCNFLFFLNGGIHKFCVNCKAT